MQWPNRSTLKSNFSELTLEGWLIRNFFSSELPTYMIIPTKFLLSRFYIDPINLHKIGNKKESYYFL